MFMLLYVFKPKTDFVVHLCVFQHGAHGAVGAPVEALAVAWDLAIGHAAGDATSMAPVAPALAAHLRRGITADVDVIVFRLYSIGIQKLAILLRRGT